MFVTQTYGGFRQPIFSKACSSLNDSTQKSPHYNREEPFATACGHAINLFFVTLISWSYYKLAIHSQLCHKVKNESTSYLVGGMLELVYPGALWAKSMNKEGKSFKNSSDTLNNTKETDGVIKIHTEPVSTKFTRFRQM